MRHTIRELGEILHALQESIRVIKTNDERRINKLPKGDGIHDRIDILPEPEMEINVFCNQDTPQKFGFLMGTKRYGEPSLDSRLSYLNIESLGDIIRYEPINYLTLYSFDRYWDLRGKKRTEKGFREFVINSLSEEVPVIKQKIKEALEG